METSKSDEHGFQSSQVSIEEGETWIESYGPQVEREVGSVLHEKYKESTSLLDGQSAKREGARVRGRSMICDEFVRAGASRHEKLRGKEE